LLSGGKVGQAKVSSKVSTVRPGGSKLLECVETPFKTLKCNRVSLVMETQPIALSQLLFVFSFFNRS
jgi:hypothetical protein